jgi:hypothetical protein
MVMAGLWWPRVGRARCGPWCILAVLAWNIEHEHMSDGKWFNAFMQVGLIGFTMLGFLLTSLKMPQYGLVANLISEIFWLYSSYRAWKEANQIGIFITTIAITIILISGVINYWVL